MDDCGYDGWRGFIYNVSGRIIIALNAVDGDLWSAVLWKS